MSESDLQTHWDNAYRIKGESGVSWFEESPAISLDLIRATGMGANGSIVDIGGGRRGWSMGSSVKGLRPSQFSISPKRRSQEQRRDSVLKVPKCDGSSPVSRPGSQLRPTTCGTTARRSIFRPRRRIALPTASGSQEPCPRAAMSSSGPLLWTGRSGAAGCRRCGMTRPRSRGCWDHRSNSSNAAITCT